MQKPDKPSIERMIELQQLIANFAKVERLVHLADTKRPENDVEHSFGLAIICWFLSSHIASELSTEKILKYALVHDLVEIYAGDTYAFAEQKHLERKLKREADALARLSKEWKDFPDLLTFINRYEHNRDEEAKFVYAVDKFLPVLMLHQGEGRDWWRKHKVTHEVEAKQKAKMLVSKHIAPYYDELLLWLKDNKYYYDPEEVD